MALMRRSLTMVLALLVMVSISVTSAQAHGSKKIPNSPAYITCQSTTETDNVYVSNGSYNPYTDNYYADPSYGNQWEVYYDVKYDAYDGVTACDMRVVVRIFPPTNGSWSGTLAVGATDSSGTNISAAYSTLGGNTTYPGHLVYRGPWFGGTCGGRIYSNFWVPNGRYWTSEAYTYVCP